jgi:hypothetical protein
MQGGEYLSAEGLEMLWRSVQQAFEVELTESRPAREICAPARRKDWHSD